MTLDNYLPSKTECYHEDWQDAGYAFIHMACAHVGDWEVSMGAVLTINSGEIELVVAGPMRMLMSCKEGPHCTLLRDANGPICGVHGCDLDCVEKIAETISADSYPDAMQEYERRVVLLGEVNIEARL